ncbi:MAG: class sortase [Candidatus Saccharibacteria bacterium]|nr:class sortase [Candidatus Saccharibacteria bacterium]
MNDDNINNLQPSMPPIIKGKGSFMAGKNNPAADLIRQKLHALYANEPDVVEEAVETAVLPSKHSKHQQFMHELSASGKPLAVIQTEWHNYYTHLDDEGKRQVWQEFYAANEQQSSYFKAQTHAAQLQPVSQPVPEQPQVIAANPEPAFATIEAATRSAAQTRASALRSVAELKKQITSKVRVRGKLSKKQHMQSLGFGLSMGAVVIIILLFGFFNERFIAPFITPSRNVSATPLILDPNNATVDASPQVIIPKINVQAPVVYDVPTINENDVESGLERGIVHYVTTSNPGEQGNSVFFGHSSSNILNRGKYKFAFVLLSWLNEGDTFYLQKGGVRYVYKVFEKKIVPPSDVSVLNPVDGHISTATLITCDPPGTNVNRLIIVGDQISPDPGGNAASTALKTDAKPAKLAGNSESLWHRIVHAIF